MAVVALTPEQEAALATPGPVVAVAAGAGSGKTTMLVEAIWRDVEGGGIAPERILVATYNRAAAAHIAARLAARFADPDDGRPADRAALDLAAGWVGTFHALCARIVRESPFAAGVDPAFTELDAVASRALLEEAMDHAVETAEHPGLMELLACAWSPQPVRDAIEHVHARLRAAGHAEPRVRVPHADPPAPALRERLRRLAGTLARHPDARQGHLDAAEAALVLADADVLPSRAPAGSRNCTKALKPLCEEFNAAAAELFDAIADRLAAEQLGAFAALLEGTDRYYAGRKAELGALDYEDLLLAARDVLRAGSPYRFARAYVDEFQDANPVQDEIIDLLGADRTVVVGDACQAIYGFRHADAGPFEARRARAAGAGLHDNHRSQPELLGALNGWLAGALATEPAFRPLAPRARPDAEAPALASPPAELITVTTADGKADRRHEAHAVAATVADLLDRGYRPRDVAVLFRALTEVGEYERALAARVIPTHLVAGRGFFAHDQVADALALLRVVENPWDEPALVRVLASPYVAASDATLVALRAQAGEGAPLWPAVARVPALGPAAAMVGRLRDARRDAGLAGLVDAAVGAGDHDLTVLGLDGGRRRFANLRRLVLMAASFAAVRGDDLGGFLRLVAAQAEQAAQDPGEATLVDPDLEAVRLSTVHGVKGQEFPVVVLADASHRVAGAAPMVLVDTGGRAGIRMQRHGEDNHEALGFTELKRLRQEAEHAEERRIAYVALTRAQRHLVVVGRHAGGGPTGYAILAGPAATAAGVATRDMPVDDVAPPDPGALPELPPAARVDALAPVPAPHADALLGRRLSASALADHATCSLRAHLERDLGLAGSDEDRVIAAVPEGVPPRTPSPWPGGALGGLVHARLEAHDWGARREEGRTPGNPGWATAAAARAGLPAWDEGAARAEELVARIAGSPLAARIAAGAAVAERRFATAVDGTLLTGAIDVMVALPDGAALVCDWKSHGLSDERTPGALMAGYELQRALYGLVALRAGHTPVELAWVFLEAPDDPQTRVVDARGAPALEGEVRAALAALRRPPQPAATTPQPFCSGCPGLRAVCPVARAYERPAGP